LVREIIASTPNRQMWQGLCRRDQKRGVGHQINRKIRRQNGCVFFTLWRAQALKNIRGFRVVGLCRPFSRTRQLGHIALLWRCGVLRWIGAQQARISKRPILGCMRGKPRQKGAKPLHGQASRACNLRQICAGALRRWPCKGDRYCRKSHDTSVLDAGVS
jgi:hypothetical protein